MEKKKNCRVTEMTNSIRTIGELLINKAEDIAKDIDEDYVSDVTIYTNLSGDWGSAPSVSITKEYMAISEPKHNLKIVDLPKAKGDD